MKVRSKAPLIATMAFMLSAPSVTIAGVVVSTDRFGYTGTVSDGSQNYNITNNRDLSLYIIQDPQPYDPLGDINQILTAWYYTGSPSNVMEGFVQLDDPDGSTDTELSGFWSADLKTFTFSLKGKNTTGVDNRLWDGLDGPDYGQFLDYSLDLTAQFANAAINNGSGFYYIEDDPTSVSGSFTGHFRNDSTVDYDFNFALNMNSWVANDSVANQERLSQFPTYFGSNVVPEPGTLALLGLGFMGLAATRRRKVIG